MSATLRLAHINIENHQHLELVIPFLLAQKPDVICLQELDEVNVPQFEQELGMPFFFVPMMRTSRGVCGLGIGTLLPCNKKYSEYYGGSVEALPVADKTSKEILHATMRFMLAICEVEKEGESFRIGTTHFPVTDKGEPTDFQRKDARELLFILDRQGEIVFTGDFNAPRGGEIFSMLAEKYKDNVPPQYTTSLDGNIHRAGPLPYMVDGIFSTPGYSVSSVELIAGVSDHMALVAAVSKS